MRVKGGLFLLSTLFVMSICANIYLYMDRSVDKQQESIESSLKKEDLKVEDTEESGTNKSNPIDDFFDNHPLTGVSTAEMRNYAAIYSRCWESEMENAYRELSKRAPKDIKERIAQSQETFVKFAKNEAYLSRDVNASDAFMGANGKASETYSYSNIGPLVISETLSQLYKQRALEIYKYLKCLGIEINYIFNEQNLSKDDLEFLKYQENH